MSNTSSPNQDTHKLLRLLEAPIGSEEEMRLLAELDERGRQTLEDLAADPEFRRDVHKHLGQPPVDDPSIAQILASIDAALPEPDPPSLDFLDPPESDEYLGQFEGYLVIECIGSGGMGVVLKAFEPSLDRIVALKVLAPQLAANVNARRRFLREARAAAAVSHDHTITIYAVSESGRLPYLVMEYIGGVSLQQRINAEGPLPLEEVLRIGMQVASGLAAAHAQGVVHRDVKPGNILLENGVQRVTITDFGLARALDDGSVTRSGMLVGTPEYMSPEQARGEPLDARADLFSLGSVIYAMCTGESPFRADTLAGTIHRVCETEPPPIQQLAPHVPDWLSAIVEKLHAKAAANRYPSAAEVAEKLTGHLADLQQQARAVGGKTPPPTQMSRNRAWRMIVPSTVALIAAGAAVAMWLPNLRFQSEVATPSDRATKPAAELRASARSGLDQSSFDVERRVAQWTLSKDGEVTLHQFGRIEQPYDLPAGLIKVQSIALWNRDIVDHDLSRFVELADLQGLELPGNELSDDALPQICQVTSLRWLYLGKMNLSDSQLHRLGQLHNLESLGLNATLVTDDGLRQIEVLPSLREFLLANTAIGDPALAHLATFTTLVRLDLFGTRVTDDGLQHLQSLPNLTYLILQQTEVTDAGLELLSKLPSLKQLNVKQTNVTAAGIERFQEARPTCLVEH